MIQTRDGEQWWLLAYMKSLGHFQQLNPEALCQGVAAAGAHAVLAEDTALFYKRLTLITQFPVEEFPEAVRLAEEKRKQQNTLTEKEEACLSFKALCDTFALAQAPKDFPELFDKEEVGVRQNLQAALKILTPVKLENQGGVERAFQLKGSYTLAELTAYFQSLQQALKDFTHPVSLVLRNGIHALTIGYDPQDKKFTLINANALALQEKDSKALKIIEPEKMEPAGLAAAIIPALFSKNQIATFETGVYVTKVHEAELKSKLTPWTQQKSFQEMYLKGNQLDSNKIGLLYLAAYTNDFELAVKLLENKANPKQTTEDGASPLFIAAQNSYPQLVQLLLQHGASTQPEKPMGGPLHVAAMGADLTIANDLIRFGADVNQTNALGSTPLYFAASKGNLAMVAFLLEKGALPDQPSKSGATPIDIARAFNHPEITRLLTEARTQIIASKKNECETLYNARGGGSLPRLQALEKLKTTMTSLATAYELDKTLNTFKKLDQLAQGLQKLLLNYKPINNDRKVLVEFLKSKMDGAYKTYAAAAPGTEKEAYEDLCVTAKMIRKTIQEETKAPGFFSNLFSKKAPQADPLEKGLASLIEGETPKTTLK
jgi:ankyrin repeat protein